MSPKNGLITTVMCTVVIVLAILGGIIWVHAECKDMIEGHVDSHGGLDHRLDRIESKVDQILMRGK